ncbi:LuxR C-terminal-related transcriptional regulator [Pseudomonas sp. NPDC077649]|uniref:LuxR C-terminal-related transcriptional regulator n=1 Tax=Pseudomonas sp. NPDC077649 TaxID=3364423 RepID=UPI0037CB7EA8
MLTDCRPLVLMGLHDVITAQRPRMDVCGQATTYARALDLAEQLDPDVIFFSFFPDALDPLQVIAQLAHTGAAEVLVLKGLYEAIPTAQAIKAGARDIVLADDPPESIIRAITQLQHRDNRARIDGRNGQRVQLRLPAKSPREPSKPVQLTLRERELIRAIVDEPSAKYISIAGQLGISEHTVHNHLSNIYHKLNLVNRIDLLMYAMKHGITGSEDPHQPSWAESD